MTGRAPESIHDFRAERTGGPPLSGPSAPWDRRTGTSNAGSVDEALQDPTPARMAQLAQRLRLDLADALARHLEVLPDLFERVVAVLADAEAHHQHLLLARRERRQHLARVLREARDQRVLLRRERV